MKIKLRYDGPDAKSYYTLRSLMFASIGFFAWCMFTGLTEVRDPMVYEVNLDNKIYHTR